MLLPTRFGEEQSTNKVWPQLTLTDPFLMSNGGLKDKISKI